MPVVLCHLVPFVGAVTRQQQPHIIHFIGVKYYYLIGVTMTLELERRRMSRQILDFVLKIVLSLSKICKFSRMLRPRPPLWAGGCEIEIVRICKHALHIVIGCLAVGDRSQNTMSRPNDNPPLGVEV